jgi:uncharacterized protein (TIGR03435 family)
LLPAGLADNLNPGQFDAILNHEARHVQCCDNLTAALHMCVETLFWFHPLVWWIGAKLVDERERDCDEAVLRHGSHPGDYARSIVHVCETYVESPLVCASGISGADLKQRIREIMTWRGSLPVTWVGKVALTATAVVAVMLPFAFGILRAQTLPAPPAYGYGAVSIHRSDHGATDVNFSPGPNGGLRTENTPVISLLSFAYDVQNYQILDAPGWASTEHFDVVFTPETSEKTLNEDSSLKNVETFKDHSRQRLQAVLRDRFGLVLRSETRELPIYSMIVAKGGAKLSPHDPNGQRGPSILTNGRGLVTGIDVTVDYLARNLSMQLRRPVRDDTHLTGQYDFKLNWTPDLERPPDQPAAAANFTAGASLFTAITDQLGLRLESTKGPVQVYVVEKLERPSEN